MSLLNQLTQASTYRELQAALKAARTEGYEIPCKLNAKAEVLQAARNTLVAQINQAIREEAEELPTATETLWLPEVNEDGEQFKLGDYAYLSGTAQYDLLQRLAVQDSCEQINLYRSFYARAVELGMLDRDPGFDGGTIYFDGEDIWIDE